jgi:alkylation response protein AidB-like acyl-CoA dehydrogenase
MHFAFTDEQEELRRGARRFLEAHARTRAAADSERGWDPDTWKKIGAELGWPALIVPEAHGGVGLGQVELVAVLEEMGRVLLASPFFATVALGVNALVVAGSDAQQARWLPALAEGTQTATLACEGGVVAERDGRLHGTMSHVVDGHSADLLIVAAGDTLFAVAADAAGLTRRALPTLDRTRRLAELRFDGVVAERLPVAGLAAVLDRAQVAFAAEQLGGAQACLDMAVDYAKTRVQFNRKIGSFQAIKHKCADLFVAVESARSAVYWAAAEPGPLAAATARATASEAFFEAATENLQIHGGIGFTWEHDAHLYLRRARASQALLGDVATQRERVATAILGAG